MAKGWAIGCQYYENNVYLLSVASILAEEQRSVLHREFAELGAAWHAECGTGASTA
ncbi:hypothetical protein [Streptomyces sp. NPDC002853]